MAQKLEKLTRGDDYNLAVVVDENGKQTNTVVVVDRYGKPTKKVVNGALQENAHNVNSDGSLKASGFESGLASVSFTTPEYGQGLMYGGENKTIYITRSGYVIDSGSKLVETAKSAYENPGELTHIKWRDGNPYYADEYKVLLDVAQHSFEAKGRALEEKYLKEQLYTRNGFHAFEESKYTEKQYVSDLKELEKLAKKVVAHLAKELEKANKGNNRNAIKGRINALTSPETALEIERGGN